MRLERYIERMWYAPEAVDWAVVAGLAPLSSVYGGIMYIRRRLAKPKRYEVPIVSVGNLVVGGTGKTPFVVALASRYRDVAVISRGYGRQSKGLVEVSRRGTILCDVRQSGDEAMLMAVSLPHASVIVSEDRHLAVRKAIADGVRMIVLDDGFNRVDIEAFDIVLFPPHTPNRFPLPAGPFREFECTARFADMVLYEGEDYRREVEITQPRSRMVLATSIARAERLEPYLPEGVVFRYVMPDHSYFDERTLRDLIERYEAQSLLVTEKDAVKLADFKLPLSVMKLKLHIDDKALEPIAKYLEKAGYETKT